MLPKPTLAENRPRRSSVSTRPRAHHLRREQRVSGAHAHTLAAQETPMAHTRGPQVNLTGQAQRLEPPPEMGAHISLGVGKEPEAPTLPKPPPAQGSTHASAHAARRAGGGRSLRSSARRAPPAALQSQLCRNGEWREPDIAGRDRKRQRATRMQAQTSSPADAMDRASNTAWERAGLPPGSSSSGEPQSGERS